MIFFELGQCFSGTFHFPLYVRRIYGKMWRVKSNYRR